MKRFKRTPVAEPEAPATLEPSAVEKALLALPAAIAKVRVDVTVEGQPRLTDWIFDFHRDNRGQVTRVTAKGLAK